MAGTKTQFRRPGMRSPEWESTEQLGTEETLGRIRDLLSGSVLTSGAQKTVPLTKHLAAAGDYAAEDVMSEAASGGTAWRFVGIASANGRSGYITKAQALCSTTALTPRLTLYLFSAAPTSVLNDNVANTAVLEADLAKYVGKIDLPALEDLGGMSEIIATPNTSGNLPVSFTCAGDTSDLWGIVVTRDAITGEAAGMRLTIRLTAERY